LSDPLDIFEVITSQRACRAFLADPVDDDAIARILTAATYAPSAENRQPWEFVVVRDDATRAALGDLTRRAWDSGGRTFAEGRLPANLLADVDHGATGGVAHAPIVIVVCADTQRGLEQTVPSSIFPAVQNLLLAATALGLGSALTTITTGFRAELQGELGLPEHVWPVALIPIGHPAQPLGPPRREPFATHTHRERYGMSW
jgi:nitroreductase